jgi:hypothetical protein
LHNSSFIPFQIITNILLKSVFSTQNQLVRYIIFKCFVSLKISRYNSFDAYLGGRSSDELTPVRSPSVKVEPRDKLHSQQQQQQQQQQSEDEGNVFS